MTSIPGPVAATASSMYPAERWSKTACALSRRTRAIPRRSPQCRDAQSPARAIWTAATLRRACSVDKNRLSGTARIRWKRAPGGGVRYATAAPCAYETLAEAGDPRNAAERKLA